MQTAMLTALCRNVTITFGGRWRVTTMEQVADPQLRKPPYGLIASGLKRGGVIPFFGAAASAIYNRQPNEPWQPGKPFMPFGGELAMTLAGEASYPEDLISNTMDLAQIASWVEHVQGDRDDINDTLRRSFGVECNPGDLHQAISRIEKVQLFITTNYDDLLEKALASRQPHVIIDHGSHGLWVTAFGEEPERVTPTGGRIEELLNKEPIRPILFKMHGSINKADAEKDSYLITEEDYVDFLGRDGGHYVPTYISKLMRGKKVLFLGYSLADWNVRVILRKLLKGTRTAPAVRCWAIVSGHSPAAQQIWHAQKLNIYPMDLLDFAKQLASYL
jgi:hypothetical protein